MSSVENSNPRWMERLRGENPLISSRQHSFISEVRSSILRKGSVHGSKSHLDVNEVKDMADKILNNFEKVLEHLRSSGCSRKMFMDKYPQWEIVRYRNIRQLTEIAKEVETNTQNCQTAKILGSLVSLFGGVLCLAAEGEGRMMGSVMMGLGTLTSTGTSAVEELFLRENISKSQGIMQLDKEILEGLLEWLGTARRLERGLRNIKSFNREGSLQEAAEKCQDISEKNLSPNEQDRQVQVVLKSLNFPPELSEEISNVVGILIATAMLIKRFHPLFQFVIKSYDLVSKLRLSVDLFRGAYIGMNAVATAGETGSLTSAQKRKIASGMALDAANILIIALQGSNRVEAQEIRTVVNLLEREAVEFRRLYQEMEELDF